MRAAGQLIAIAADGIVRFNWSCTHRQGRNVTQWQHKTFSITLYIEYIALNRARMPVVFNQIVLVQISVYYSNNFCCNNKLRYTILLYKKKVEHIFRLSKIPIDLKFRFH